MMLRIIRLLILISITSLLRGRCLFSHSIDCRFAGVLRRRLLPPGLIIFDYLISDAAMLIIGSVLPCQAADAGDIFMLIFLADAAALR